MPECDYINKIVTIPRALDTPKFWIWQNFEYRKVLNVQELHRVLNMVQYDLYVWIRRKYALICLNLQL